MHQFNNYNIRSLFLHKFNSQQFLHGNIYLTFIIIKSKMLVQSKQLVKAMITGVKNNFSKTQLINVPPAKYADHRQELLKNGWRDTDVTHKKSQQTHLSNSEYLIHKIPIIYSHDSVVRCLGGTQIGAGHPQVYIQLNTKTPGEPVSCKWCGLKYALDTHHH